MVDRVPTDADIDVIKSPQTQLKEDIIALDPRERLKKGISKIGQAPDYSLESEAIYDEDDFQERPKGYYGETETAADEIAEMEAIATPPITAAKNSLILNVENPDVPGGKMKFQVQTDQKTYDILSNPQDLANPEKSKAYLKAQEEIQKTLQKHWEKGNFRKIEGTDIYEFTDKVDVVGGSVDVVGKEALREQNKSVKLLEKVFGPDPLIASKETRKYIRGLLEPYEKEYPFIIGTIGKPLVLGTLEGLLASGGAKAVLGKYDSAPFPQDMTIEQEKKYLAGRPRGGRGVMRLALATAIASGISAVYEKALQDFGINQRDGTAILLGVAATPVGATLPWLGRMVRKLSGKTPLFSPTKRAFNSETVAASIKSYAKELDQLDAKTFYDKTKQLHGVKIYPSDYIPDIIKKFPKAKSGFYKGEPSGLEPASPFQYRKGMRYGTKESKEYLFKSKRVQEAWKTQREAVKRGLLEKGNIPFANTVKSLDALLAKASILGSDASGDIIKDGKKLRELLQSDSAVGLDDLITRVENLGGVIEKYKKDGVGGGKVYGLMKNWYSNFLDDLDNLGKFPKNFANVDDKMKSDMAILFWKKAKLTAKTNFARTQLLDIFDESSDFVSASGVMGNLKGTIGAMTQVGEVNLNKLKDKFLTLYRDTGSMGRNFREGLGKDLADKFAKFLDEAVEYQVKTFGPGGLVIRGKSAKAFEKVFGGIVGAMFGGTMGGLAGGAGAIFGAQVPEKLADMMSSKTGRAILLTFLHPRPVNIQRYAKYGPGVAKFLYNALSPSEVEARPLDEPSPSTQTSGAYARKLQQMKGRLLGKEGKAPPKEILSYVESQRMKKFRKEYMSNVDSFLRDKKAAKERERYAYQEEEREEFFIPKGFRKMTKEESRKIKEYPRRQMDRKYRTRLQKIKGRLRQGQSKEEMQRIQAIRELKKRK